MKQIKTKPDLIEYIKMQLGYPINVIDLTDGQIEMCIDESVQRFTNYSYDRLEDVVIISIDGAKDYTLPEQISSIIKVSEGNSSFLANYGSSYVPDLWSEQFFSGNTTAVGSIIPNMVEISNNYAFIEKYIEREINYVFNSLKKKIRILENYTGKVLIHYTYDYIPDEEDHVYNHEWVKAYATAKSKFLWGTVTGKFDAALIGDARVNYADFKSEAETMIEKLNEDLLEKWSQPLPILVG